MTKTEIDKIWEETGLKKGDKDGLIELIERDVTQEILTDYFDRIDPKGELLEEEFMDIVDSKLLKWSTNKLLIFWEKNHYR